MNDITKIRNDNFGRIQFNKFEKDFSFIVNGEIYQTNSFVANILSPNISKMFDENMKVACYEINTEYEGVFNKIIEYGEMKAININEDEKPYFENVLKLLGNNIDAYKSYNEIQEDISFENVIQRIKTKIELNMNIDEEITFISSNFYDFNKKYPEAIFTLNSYTIEQILSNNKLKIHNEEELFDIVLKLYTKSKKYSTLFSYVIFMNLPTKSTREFTQVFDINDINTSIWESICCRLERDISIESKTAYKNSNQSLFDNRYIGKKYEDNILQHLSEECNGNVHLHNIVHITSSSIYSDYYRVENIVEQNDDKYFQTKNESNSWIQFDFRERKVLLNSYTLKSSQYSENFGHPKSWILEVSNDGHTYTEIDRQENCNLLNGKRKTATFQVSCSDPQRFVRLRQTGKNWYGNYHLIISNIEFSGLLSEWFL